MDAGRLGVEKPEHLHGPITAGVRRQFTVIGEMHSHFTGFRAMVTDVILLLTATCRDLVFS